MRFVVHLALLLAGLAAGAAQSSAGGAGPDDGPRLLSPPEASPPFELSKIVPPAVADENARTDDWYERSYRACAASATISDPSVDRAGRTPAGNSQRDYVRNKLSLTRSGRAIWNGTPVDLATLRQYLELTTAMMPKPLLVVETRQGAPDNFVRAVHGVVVRSGVCRGLPTGEGD